MHFRLYAIKQNGKHQYLILYYCDKLVVITHMQISIFNVLRITYIKSFCRQSYILNFLDIIFASLFFRNFLFHANKYFFQTFVDLAKLFFW